MVQLIILPNRLRVRLYVRLGSRLGFSTLCHRQPLNEIQQRLTLVALLLQRREVTC